MICDVTDTECELGYNKSGKSEMAADKYNTRKIRVLRGACHWGQNQQKIPHDSKGMRLRSRRGGQVKVQKHLFPSALASVGLGQVMTIFLHL